MLEQNSLNLEETSTVDNVEKYKFEPIKGYPMLHWHGKRPFTSTQYYPAQKKEIYGEEVNGWINKIFWGDNLQVMSHLLKEYRGKIDLIYIDPPFDSKADYKKEVKVKAAKIKNESTSFEEKQYGDIWSNDEYLQFMYERMILAKELLSDTGSIYVQCDWHKSHHIRCILDEVFGDGGPKGKEGGFKNEIIWCYSDAANSKTQWNTKHDTIYFYTKTSKWTFNFESVLREMSESNIKKYKYTEEDGSKYRLFGKNIQGSPIQWHRDVSPEWEETNPELVYRHYLKEGSLALDWWNINPVNQAAKERTGYPTQKPEALMEQIIKASSNKGDLLFDFFMGSATFQNVAMKLGRKFIGADINLGAVQTATKRLIITSESLRNKFELSDDNFYTGVEVYNVNHYDVFRNPIEAAQLLLDALEIEPLSNSIYDGKKDGYMVKVMPVNRIATREDLNDLVGNFPYKVFEQRKENNPNKPVESIMLICMGHEPDLKAYLEQECGHKLNVEVVDILRDRSNIEFKRDSEASIAIVKSELVIRDFFPMNLMQKLSLQKETVSEWRELVDSIVIDWNYDGAAMEPSVIDLPEKNEFVQGKYTIPDHAGTIKIKITDLLSESYEEVIQHG